MTYYAFLRRKKDFSSLYIHNSCCLLNLNRQWIYNGHKNKKNENRPQLCKLQTNDTMQIIVSQIMIFLFLYN